MSLAVGMRLGTYEVTGLLGAGGMGEVYRARDAKLNRDVALKVLPETVATDPDRLARFQREAQLLASLNHPNIGSIYGLEDANRPALVLELVDGPTLADRIAQGPVAIDEVLPIARQIAEALEAAHEKGIIHRDLKPANIKLTPEGKVKVLDFGLAKLNDPNVSNGPNDANLLTISPTLLSPAATQVGVILGTAAYMAPEQAKGRGIDQRADIWAFGCVLYEMLTGGPAFPGQSISEIVSEVLKGEPDWRRLPADTPAHLRRLLARCLQKDPGRRLHHVADARLDLDESVADSLVAVAAVRRPMARALPWAAALVVTLFAFGAATAWTFKPTSSRQLIHLALPLPAGARLATVNTPVLSLAPDGSRIAFVAVRDGRRQLYVRSFGAAEAMPIPGTEGAENPFFSPDGQWLGFVARGMLMKVSMSGGAPFVICAGQNVQGASWGADDTIVFAPVFGTTGLSAVAAAGGQPRAVTSRDTADGEEGHRWPHLLPGGKAVLFTAWSRNLDEAQVVVQRLDTGERKVIARGGTFARYVPTGHLVYARAGALVAVPFDLSRLEAVGNAVPAAQSVLLTVEGAAQFDVSGTGSFVYVPGELLGAGRRLVWLDRSGREDVIDAPPDNYTAPRLSPDGQQIAVVVQGANDDVWIYDIPRRTLSRLTFESRSLTPVWSADGKRIIYRSSRDGRLNLFERAADGSGVERRLTASAENQAPSAVSPDGQTLAFQTTGRDVWTMTLGGDGKARPFLQSAFVETGAVFSPDGRWLAYASDESGRFEIYAQPFPDGGRKVRISRDGGEAPRWTNDGLFYRAAARVLFVPVKTQPDVMIGQPETIFEGPQYTTTAFDVRGDGQRLVMVKESDQSASATQIEVVLNWTAAALRLVPVK